MSDGSLRRKGPAKPSRKLNFPSRVRKRLRTAVDRVLAANVVWTVALVLAFVFAARVQRPGENYDSFVVGRFAPRDVRAPHDLELVDETLTEERRRSARAEVPAVYVHDTESAARLAERLQRIFADGRHFVSAEPGPAGRSAASVRMAGRVPADALARLLERGFDVALERELIDILQSVLARRVVANKELLARELRITLVQAPGGRREALQAFDDFIDLADAQAAIRERTLARLGREREGAVALAEFVGSFADANVHFDRDTTLRARQNAAFGVHPVLTRVAEGELLVREGDVLNEGSMARIDALRRASRGTTGAQEFFALLLLGSLFAFFLQRYCRYHQRGFRKLQHLHALLVLMLLSMVALTRSMLWLAGQLVDGLGPPFNQLSSYAYFVPLGTGAILVALLANGRIATVYSAFAALLFGAAQRWDAQLMLWAMFVQCAGVYAISTYRERAALLRAGLVVGGAGCVTSLALETLTRGAEQWTRGLYGAGLAFLGGAMGAGLLISFSLPLLERLFNVLTDIRLLELSNVNTPLLSELAVKAPGSYNHSLVVGTLSEEAARAIGANALFCRVAAFYHDVGKLNMAEYYAENQRGTNPHDRLTPSMSALIIAAHVKDGIKMAREAGLPEQIVDIIPQHHGTKLMTYFYEKAKRSADPDLGPVKQDDFRYPGPKPQTREAAIFMLADAVEAAARTVDEPSAHRFKDMVRKVSNAIVLDGQLDACDLTFADLDRIHAAFLRCLVSMYHHRVDYPGFEFNAPTPDPKADPRPGGPVESTAADSAESPEAQRGPARGSGRGRLRSVGRNP